MKQRPPAGGRKCGRYQKGGEFNNTDGLVSGLRAPGPACPKPAITRPKQTRQVAHYQNFADFSGMNPTNLASAESRVTLYHRRHGRHQARKSLGHVGPALVLFFGMAPLLSGQERLTPLLALEVAVGAAYLVLMVRELLHLRHNPFRREAVAWLEVAAAGILAIESYHIWHRHHEAELAGAPHRVHLLPWLYGAVAVMYVVMAFCMKQVDGRRFLHLHPDGFSVRTKRLGAPQHLRWSSIVDVEPHGPADLLVHRTDGQTQRISFADMHEGAGHRDRLLAHARTGLPGLGGYEPGHGLGSGRGEE